MVKQIIVSIFLLFMFSKEALPLGIAYLPVSMNGFDPEFTNVAHNSPLNDVQLFAPQMSSSMLSDTTIIDFERRKITFMKYDPFSGAIHWRYHYAELDQYYNSLFISTALIMMRNGIDNDKTQDKKVMKRMELALSLPVHYPAWARRVLGTAPPKLSVTGFLSLSLKYENSSYTSGGEEQTTSNNGNLLFDYDTQFKIRGSVGDLVSIHIELSKKEKGEALKDDLKSLRIEYKAPPDSANMLEDEIIQEIVAGFTNFQMPGQGLAGYSGSHEGLFGIKMRSQWGPLELTTIVSREKSEKQTRKLNPEGGGNTLPISELDFMRDTYFFLDSAYLNYYNTKTTENTNAPPSVTQLRIYRRLTILDVKKVGETYMQAIFGFDNTSTTAAAFVLLKENEDYYLNSKRGYIRFMPGKKPNSKDLIAMVLRTEDGSISHGQLPEFGDPVSVANVIILKQSEHDANSSDPSFYLEWRNVYSIPSSAQPSDFTITITRKSDDGSTVETPNGSSKKFIDILNIAENGQLRKDIRDIFDFDNKHLILPPIKDNETKNRPFSNPELGEYKGETNTQTLMYDSNNVNGISAKYDIVMSGSQRKTEFVIGGWGIFPNTEIIKDQSGNVLKRGIDYHIDYNFGQLTLLSDKAKAATSLTVEFEQESLFSFDSKVFLGAYGKLDLPNVGTNSYFATSVMGQLTSSRDKIPRVGSEPFSRFLFDANLHLDFEPEWMSKAINIIPLIKTNAKSTATIDVETAYSRISPESESKGKAYIDNFQSSQTEFSLGSHHASWYKASPPIEIKSDPTRPPAWKTYWYLPIESEQSFRREIYDVEQEIKDADGSNVPKFLSSLRIVTQMVTDELAPQVTDSSKESNKRIAVNPWAGIMHPLVGTLKKRDQDRYFGFWLKAPKKNGGKLYIDLGILNENIIINGKAPDNIHQVEKIDADYSTIVTNDVDIGLDSLSDKNEYTFYPHFTFNGGVLQSMAWDSLGWKDPRLGIYEEDPGRDNYKPYQNKKLDNKVFVNGLENNGSVLDREDINRDGILNRNTEHYFRISIDLNNIDKHIDIIDDSKTSPRAKSNGWYYFKIPVNSDDNSHYYEEINGPQWTEIEFVRIVWSDLSTDSMKLQTDSIEIMDMKFTGNYWSPTASTDSLESKIGAIVYNSEDDFSYEPPPAKDLTNKEGRKTNRDYALSITYSNVAPGEIVMLQKKLSEYQTMDFTSYKEIRMWLKELDVHSFDVGATTDLLEFSDGKLANPVGTGELPRFIFRFGLHDSSYYEYSTTFWRYDNNMFGNDTSVIRYDTSTQNRYWNSEDGLVINLKQITQLKESYLKAHGNNPRFIDTSVTLLGGDQIRIYSKRGVLPTISKVQWLSYGIKRDSSAMGIGYGEIMINGLMTQGLASLDGWAFRADLKTHWADFMDFSAGIAYDEADFKQMSESPTTNKSSSISANLNAQWALNKFLPDKWGVAMPFGISMSSKLTRPKRRPGSDISLVDNDGDPDNLSDMIEDFSNLLLNLNLANDKTDAEHYEQNLLKQSFYTSFNKTNDSKNPISRFTIDRLSTAYSYSYDTTTQREGVLADSDIDLLEQKDIGEDHIYVSAKRIHNSNLKYDLTPRKRPKWSAWSPFKAKRFRKIPHHWKKYTLNLLPSKLNFDIFEGSYFNHYRYKSLDDILSDSIGAIIEEGLKLTHGYQFSYAPIDPLIKASYDWQISRDFQDDLKLFENYDNNKSRIPTFIRSFVFKHDTTWSNYKIFSQENNRTQKGSITIAPQFFKWLTHTGNYNSTYSQKPQNRLDDETNYLQSRLTSSFDFSSTLRIRDIFSSLSDLTEKKDSNKNSSNRKLPTTNNKRSDISKLHRQNKLHTMKQETFQPSEMEPSKTHKDSVNIRTPMGLHDVFVAIENGLNNIGLSTFTFGYRASLNLNNDYLDIDYFNDEFDPNRNRQDLYRYMNYKQYTFGLRNRGFKDVVLGEMDDKKAFCGVKNRVGDRWAKEFYDRDAQITSRSWDISTSIKFPNPLEITFKPISLGWSYKYTLKADTLFYDHLEIFPDLRITAMTRLLEKVPIIILLFKNFGLRSTFNFRVEDHVTWDGTYDNRMNKNFKHDKGKSFSWTPLVAVDGKIKKIPIGFDYSFNFTRDSSIVIWNDTTNKHDNSHARVKTFEHKWNLKYTLKGKENRNITLFDRWTIPLKGDIDIATDISFKESYELNNIAGLTKSIDKKNMSFTLHPNLTYDFTDNIDGKIEYSFSRNETGETPSDGDKNDYEEGSVRKIHSFGMTITIYFK